MKPLIIGASLGRTGTYSLKLALERLGFFPCLHMSDFAADADLCCLWLGELKKAEPDWGNLLHGYRAVVDWPACNHLYSLLRKFPDARIIYTERPFESWYQSVSQTIVPALKWLKNIPLERRSPFFELVEREVLFGSFGDALEKPMLQQSYERHRNNILGLARPEQLLSLNIEEGWENICGFLRVSIPTEIFPRKNDANNFPQFLKRKRNSKITV
ncbi:sulfotransferase family protein [Microbulbifer harenosus]|uniref:Sulfotransferase family protein n=1 Tax=Microbulbifer harenosus TaxID=2576840 RepID=A0ABY2UIE3_9GAMM|nr:sulfotransferase family protein [Microbulbifer harenosus]TLM75656.1 hypothetical protein FDY93_15270 [Microbulbifer harenosus]